MISFDDREAVVHKLITDSDRAVNAGQDNEAQVYTQQAIAYAILHLAATIKAVNP